MTARIFVDTNVFGYQLDTREPQKQARARAWMEGLWAAHSGRVSFQVLGELYVTLTRKLTPASLQRRRRSMSTHPWEEDRTPTETIRLASPAGKACDGPAVRIRAAIHAAKRMIRRLAQWDLGVEFGVIVVS